MKTLDILYEDNHLIVINKPAGALVQGDKTGDPPIGEAIKAYIKEKYDKPGAVFLGVTHRIDRPVSGALIFARTSKALERLNRMFQQKQIQKTYWAVVEKAPPRESDSLVHYLKKNQQKNKSFASETPQEGALRSELSYRLVGSTDRYHLLEVHPKTGRHHQIRVQLSTIGCIIKGDLKYGAKRSNPDASIHLHARSIRFEHPVRKEPLDIVAAPPIDPLWTRFVELAGE